MSDQTDAMIKALMAGTTGNEIPYQYNPLIQALGPFGQVRVLGKEFARQKHNLYDYFKNLQQQRQIQEIGGLGPPPMMGEK